MNPVWFLMDRGAEKVAVRYYLIAVLFILFDIEVIFVLPWAIVFRQVGFPGFWLMVIFLVILEVAFVYAWKKEHWNGIRAKNCKYGCGNHHP